MRIVITGGAGFLGARLARKLLELGSLTDRAGRAREITSLVLLDIVSAPVSPDQGRRDYRRSCGPGGDQARRRPTPIRFHLAAVVSGQAEAEFDVGMRVNLDITRALLERCRTLAAPPKFVFTSSLRYSAGYCRSCPTTP
jgi:nucleoside-diphosphate-sugar epimerase